jgi:hypothetical protein
LFNPAKSKYLNQSTLCKELLDINSGNVLYGEIEYNLARIFSKL